MFILSREFLESIMFGDLLTRIRTLAACSCKRVYMKRIVKFLVVNLLFIFLVAPVFGQDTLTTVQFDMNSCIPLYFDDGTCVAASRETLDSLIRKDGSEERCLEMLKEFDIEHFSLLGINLNSGSCRVPLGLGFVTTSVDREKKYVLEISYDQPVEPCRAMSSYDLWVIVPALPQGYEVEFIINPRMLGE